MKKYMLLLLALCLLTAGCGKGQEAPTTEPPASEAPAIQETEPETTVPETTEAPVVTAKPLYSEILDSYFDALLQGLEPNDYMDRGLNYLPGIVKDINEVGYCLEDLDGDGTSELLIGSVSENLIYAMYTVKNDEEIRLIDAGERNTFQLTSDGLFLNRGSNGAASFGYNLYAFQDGELKFQDALVFDAGRDEQNPWFYATTETWDTDSMTPLETANAEALEEDLNSSVVPIAFVPFAEYTT